MTNYKKIIDDTINKRLSIIFDDINKYLRKINRAYLLPGGAVLIGGSSKIQSIEIVAKKELGVPAKVHYQEFKTINGNIIRDPIWYQLCFTCMNDLQNQKENYQITGKLFAKTKQLFKKFIDPFLP
jgi:cell division ATPase FtsA